MTRRIEKEIIDEVIEYTGWLVMALLAIMLFNYAAHAQDPDNRGVSTLGLCSTAWPCDQTKQAFVGASKLRFGWLDNTFAPTCDCGVKMLKDSRPKAVRIHVLNGPCLRNHRCGPYEVLAGESIESAQAKILAGNKQLLAKYQARLDRIKLQLSQVSADTYQCYISPCLECDFNKQARKILRNMAQATLPQCAMVDNPLSPDCMDGSICEGHSSGSPYRGQNSISDLDGQSYYDIGGQEAYARDFGKSIMTLAWDYCLNGNLRVGPWVDPRERKNFCQSRDILSFQGFANPQALSVGVLNPLDKAKCLVMWPARDGAKKDFLWKLGEYKNFAITLFPVRFNKPFKSVFITKAGQVIDTAHIRPYRYTEDGSNRLIYDFTKHPSTFPKSSVLHADENCFVLDTPAFRID